MAGTVRLTREAWLKAFATGRLNLGIAFPNLGSYGMPGSPWGFSRRTLNAGILYLVINGGIRVRLPNDILEVNEGGFFMLAPGVTHALEVLTPGQPITTYHLRLHPELSKRACWLREDALHVPNMISLRHQFEGILEESAGELPWSSERTHAFFLLIFSTLFRFSRDQQRSGLTRHQRMRLSRVVRERLRSHPTPAELAAVLDLSPAYFSRQFKASYGMIPRVWLMRERLRHASLDLAESEKNITQIAEELGYQDGCLFSRQFTREFGLSPRVFRQRHRHG